MEMVMRAGSGVGMHGVGGRLGLRSGPWVKEADAAPTPSPSLPPTTLAAIYATTRTLAATGHGSPLHRPRQAGAAMQPTHAPGQDVGASFLSWPDNPTILSGRPRK